MKYDLHVHSSYSPDGILHVKDIVKCAIKKGLSGVAITDHNTIKGGMDANKFRKVGLEIVTGSEIRTEKGEIIGLFLSEEIESRNAQDVIQEIRDQNGIIIIPHPFDEMRPSSLQPSEEDWKFTDGIEGFNSRCIYQKYNRKAIEFAEKHNLAITAGSDAHFLNEIGNAGVITEADDLREAILENDIKVFGKKCSLMNHGLSKILKIWRKASSSI